MISLGDADRGSNARLPPFPGRGKPRVMSWLGNRQSHGIALALAFAASSTAAARSTDATALFLLTRADHVEPDRQGVYTVEQRIGPDTAVTADGFRVVLAFSVLAPCHYRLRVERTRLLRERDDGTSWSQTLVDFDRARHLTFKPLFDDHGPNTYQITGLTRLICVTDPMMRDCSDRLTVEADPAKPFDEPAVRAAFEQLRADCPGQG